MRSDFRLGSKVILAFKLTLLVRHSINSFIFNNLHLVRLEVRFMVSFFLFDHSLRPGCWSGLRLDLR